MTASSGSGRRSAFFIPRRAHPDVSFLIGHRHGLGWFRKKKFQRFRKRWVEVILGRYPKAPPAQIAGLSHEGPRLVRNKAVKLFSIDDLAAKVRSILDGY
jgi:hypothetical protein